MFEPGTSRAARAVGATAAFACGLLLVAQWSGSSAIVYPDTNNDYRIAKLCVDGDICPMTGVGSTFEGMNQSAPWHAELAFFIRIGMPLDTIHHALVVSEAMSFPMTFLAAVRLGGMLAGGLSVPALAMMLNRVNFNHNQVYNSRPLPFLGALLMLLLVHAWTRRSLKVLLLGSALAAYMTDIYASNALLSAGIAWIAASMFPEKRLKPVIAVLLVFGVVMLADAPAMWLENIRMFPSSWSSNLQEQREPFHVLFEGAWPVVTAAFIGAVMVSITRRGKGDVNLLLALLAPTLALYTTAQAIGAVTRTDEYLLGIMPAAAATLGWLPSGFKPALSRMPRLGLGVTAAAIAFSAWSFLDFRALSYIHRMSFDISEVGLVRDHLHDDLGWDLDDAFRGLKSPWNLELLDALFHTIPLPRRTGGLGAERVVHVMKVEPELLPVPLPPGWKILRTTRFGSLLVFESRPWLDWARLDVCVEGDKLGPKLAPGCRKESLVPWDRFLTDWREQPIPGPNRLQRYLLTLKVPVVPPVDDGWKFVLLPPLGQPCHGRIARVPPGSVILAGAKAALLRAPPAGGHGASSVWFVFDVGSSDCPDLALAGYPPFVVEARPLEARDLGYMLTALSGWDFLGLERGVP